MSDAAADIKSQHGHSELVSQSLLLHSPSASPSPFTSSFLTLSYQRAKPATKREMSQFHSDEYVEFLGRITPENMHLFGKEQGKCKSDASRV